MEHGQRWPGFAGKVCTQGIKGVPEQQRAEGRRVGRRYDSEGRGDEVTDKRRVSAARPRLRKRQRFVHRPSRHDLPHIQRNESPQSPNFRQKSRKFDFQTGCSNKACITWTAMSSNPRAMPGCELPMALSAAAMMSSTCSGTALYDPTVHQRCSTDVRQHLQTFDVIA